MAITKNSINAYTTATDVVTGSGNGTINFAAVKADVGNRVAQSGTFNVNTTAGTPQVTKRVVATLEAAAEFVEFDSAEFTTTASEGNVTVTGTSNSAALTFSLGSGDLEITLPATYSAGGLSTSNGESISGDPGATGVYAFSVVIPVSANEGVDELTRVLNVESDGGLTASATIRQSAGEPELELSAESVTVPQDGTVVTVTVTSNTTWTIVE